MARPALVQEGPAAGPTGARAVFETIGVYLGYAMARHADFYSLSHVMILGRVTSGECGDLIIGRCREVLSKESPDLAKAISVNLPDEKAKRVGQSVAAASLPALK